MQQNLFTKFFSFSYGSIIGLFLGLFSTIFTTRLLTPEILGKQSMFSLFLNIISIFCIFGTDQCIIRFFYEEKMNNRKYLFKNCIEISGIITLIISIMIIIFYKKISLFIIGKESFFLIVLLLLGVTCQIIYKFGHTLIRMNQKGNLFSFLEILNKLLNFITIIAFYSILGDTIETSIFSIIVSYCVLAIVCIILNCKYWYSILQKDKIKISFHTKKDIINYSFPLLVTLLITWLFQSFDKIAIKNWSDYEQLGLYTAAFRIIALINVMQTTFSTFWTPICYEKFQKNKNDVEFFSKVTKLISFLVFFMALLCISLKDLLIYFLGENYTESKTIMPFLIFIPVMFTLSETTVIGINFLKKPKMHIIIATVVCILNIIGNYYLVPLYGATGAAISTAFSYIVFFILRTHISLLYYPVNYGLQSIYFMIIITFIYSLITVFCTDLYYTESFGIVSIIFLIVLYKEQILIIFRFFNNILMNRMKE